MSKLIQIGLVDDELDNFHANTYLKHFKQDFTGRNVAVTGCTALKQEQGKSGRKKMIYPGLILSSK